VPSGADPRVQSAAKGTCCDVVSLLKAYKKQQYAPSLLLRGRVPVPRAELSLAHQRRAQLLEVSATVTCTWAHSRTHSFKLASSEESPGASTARTRVRRTSNTSGVPVSRSKPPDPEGSVSALHVQRQGARDAKRHLACPGASTTLHYPVSDHCWSWMRALASDVTSGAENAT
jgi:hypothetical protein